jgi:hypothetical protein
MALQLLVPLVLLGWLAFGRHHSHAAWLLKALLAGCYVIAIALGGLWLVLPWYLPLVYGVALLAALARSASRVRERGRWSVGWWPRAGTAGLAVLLLLLSGATVKVAIGRLAPPEAVDVSFPLREGTYLVANGGGNGTLNSHLATLAGDRYRRVARPELRRRSGGGGPARPAGPRARARGSGGLFHLRRLAVRSLYRRGGKRAGPLRGPAAA